MSNHEEHYKKVRELITQPALYEQLAEEATELAQAALKVARIYRNENYTPLTLGEALHNLYEEYTDVYICAQTLIINPDEEILEEKLNRWIERNKDKALEMAYKEAEYHIRKMENR